MLLNRTKLEKNTAKITIKVEVFKDVLKDTGEPDFELKDSRSIVLTNNEVKRLLACSDSITTTPKEELEDSFWKIMTLLMLDSFVEYDEQEDEITGAPNMIFGETQGEN